MQAIVVKLGLEYTFIIKGLSTIQRYLYKGFPLYLVLPITLALLIQYNLHWNKCKHLMKIFHGSDANDDWGVSKLLKGGTARCGIIADVGIARIYTVIVCGAHRHAKHANAREVWGHAPQEILKITPSEIKSEGIFSDLLPFNAPVDTGIQNIVK